jgi:hypothetical protein
MEKFKYYKNKWHQNVLRIELPFLEVGGELVARYCTLDHRDLGGVCVTGTTISQATLADTYKEITEDQFYRGK